MYLSLALFLGAPAFAQQGPWQVSASSVAVLAAESAVVSRGAPAGLKADAAGSTTADFVVVDAAEKDGAWSWTLLPLSTGTLSFVANFKSPDGRSVAAPAATFAVAVALAYGLLRGLWWIAIILVAMATSGVPYLKASVEERSVLGPNMLPFVQKALEEVANQFPGTDGRGEEIIPPMKRTAKSSGE